MSSFSKSFLFLAVIALLAFNLFGCSRAGSDYQYSCVTPIGEISIAPETDTNIHMNDGILQASRNGDSIAIPFSQCVGIKKGKQ